MAMLLVRATIPDLLGWLRRETRGIHLRRIPVGGGQLTLQTPRLEDTAPDESEDFPVVTIDGLYRQHDGGMIMLGRVIYFTLHRLKDGRMMVEAECTQAVAADLFKRVTSAMAERFRDT